LFGKRYLLDNLGSHKGKALRRVNRTVGARLVFLSKYARPQSDRAGLRQVQNPGAKAGSAKLRRRSPTPAAKSWLSTRPPNAPHTPEMPAVR